MTHTKIPKLSDKQISVLLSDKCLVAEDNKYSAHIWKFGAAVQPNVPLLIVIHTSKHGKRSCAPFVMIKSLDGDHSLIPYPTKNGYKFLPIGYKMDRGQRMTAQNFAERVLEDALIQWEQQFGPIKLTYGENETLDRDRSSFEIIKMPFVVRVHVPDHAPMHLHVYYVDPTSGEKMFHTRFKYVVAGDEQHLVHFPYSPDDAGRFKKSKTPMPDDLMIDARAAALELAPRMYAEWNELNPMLRDTQEIRGDDDLPRFHFVRAVQALADKRKAEQAEKSHSR